MATVELSGHLEKYGLLDLLRLFFGTAEEITATILCGGPAPPRIISRVTYLAEGGTLVETTCVRSTDPEFVYGKAVGMDPPIVQSRILPEAMVGLRPHPMVRREIKRQLYDMLSRLTDKKYPYGSLTGIRPTRLAAEGLAREMSADEVRHHLESDFGVATSKSALLVETAVQERAILLNIEPASSLIYLNIPFCPTRCSYCSFTCEATGSRLLDLDAYVAAMIDEAASLAPYLKSSVSALYVGGGTPTTLPARQLERLLNGILPLLPIRPDTEITVEAGRPDTIDPDKLQVIRAAGVQRICVNPQTMHDRTLIAIGRRHTVGDTFRALKEARAAGFSVINSDLIAGLPGETPADFLESVRMLIDWAPENITIHTLSYKRKSELTRSGPETMTTECQDDWSAALNQAHAALAAAGLSPYYLYRQKDMIGGLENTGYAQSGTACRYNVGMMSDERMVVGIGAGAMSKYIDRDGLLKRLPAPRDLNTYLKNREAAVEMKIKKMFWSF